LNKAIFKITLLVGGILITALIPQLVSAPIESWQYFPSLVVIRGNTLEGVSPLPQTASNITQLMECIIQCESGGDNDVRGKEGEIGIAQFKPETWDWLTEKLGENLNIYSKSDQLKVLRWSLENGYGYLWTCFQKCQ